MSEINNGNGNGTKKLTWLIGGLLFPLTVAGSSQAISSLYSTGQRVAALEVQTKELQHQLRRMEVKLDRLLEK